MPTVHSKILFVSKKEIIQKISEVNQIQQNAVDQFTIENDSAAKALYLEVAKKILHLQSIQYWVIQHFSPDTLKELQKILYPVCHMIAKCDIGLQAKEEEVLFWLESAQKISPESWDAYYTQIAYWGLTPNEPNFNKTLILLKKMIYDKKYSAIRKHAGAMLNRFLLCEYYQPTDDEMSDLLSVADPEDGNVRLSRVRLMSKNKEIDRNILREYEEIIKKFYEDKNILGHAHFDRALFMHTSTKKYPLNIIKEDFLQAYLLEGINKALLNLASFSDTHAASHEEKKQAITYLELLAKDNSFFGLQRLGEKYYYGDGVEQDIVRGLELIQRCASQYDRKLKSRSISDENIFSDTFYLLGYHYYSQGKEPEAMPLFEISYALGHQNSGLYLAQYAYHCGNYKKSLGIWQQLVNNDTRRNSGCALSFLNFRNTKNRDRVITQNAYCLMAYCHENGYGTPLNSDEARHHYTSATIKGSVHAVSQLFRLSYQDHERQRYHLFELRSLIYKNFPQDALDEDSTLLLHLELIEDYFQESDPEITSEEVLQPCYKPAAKVEKHLKAAPQLAAPTSDEQSVVSLQEVNQVASDDTVGVQARIDKILHLSRNSDITITAICIRHIGRLFNKHQFITPQLTLNTLNKLVTLFNKDTLSLLGPWDCLEIFNGLKYLRVSPDHPKLQPFIDTICKQLLSTSETNEHGISSRCTTFLINAMATLLPCENAQFKQCLLYLTARAQQHSHRNGYQTPILLHSLAIIHCQDPTLFDINGFESLISPSINSAKEAGDDRSHSQLLLAMSYLHLVIENPDLQASILESITLLLKTLPISLSEETTQSRLQIELTDLITRKIDKTVGVEEIVRGLPVDCKLNNYKGKKGNTVIIQINGPTHYLLTHTNGYNHYVSSAHNDFHTQHLLQSGAAVAELAFFEMPKEDTDKLGWIKATLQSATKAKKPSSQMFTLPKTEDSGQQPSSNANSKARTH